MTSKIAIALAAVTGAVEPRAEPASRGEPASLQQAALAKALDAAEEARIRRARVACFI